MQSTNTGNDLTTRNTYLGYGLGIVGIIGGVAGSIYQIKMSGEDAIYEAVKWAIEGLSVTVIGGVVLAYDKNIMVLEAKVYERVNANFIVKNNEFLKEKKAKEKAESELNNLKAELDEQKRKTEKLFKKLKTAENKVAEVKQEAEDKMVELKMAFLYKMIKFADEIARRENNIMGTSTQFPKNMQLTTTINTTNNSTNQPTEEKVEKPDLTNIFSEMRSKKLKVVPTELLNHRDGLTESYASAWKICASDWSAWKK
jgi:hypothetical protein